MNEYNFSYDYENYDTNEEQDFTSPYHPKEKTAGKKGSSHLLTIIQITVCTVVLATFALLKAFGGDTYSVIKNWYLQNVNNSIVAQEQIDTIKESFLNAFQSGSSSQINSSSAGTSSQEVQKSDVLVSTTAAVATKSINSQVPVSLSVLLTPPVQKNATVTSTFGWRNGTLHKGIDISAPLNTEIYSALPGKVETCTQNASYGNYLIINHGNDIKTLYAHCSSILVKSGDTVKYGQQIARVGSTGDSTGTHLHFELLIHQINYDPQPMLKTRYL